MPPRSSPIRASSWKTATKHDRPAGAIENGALLLLLLVILILILLLILLPEDQDQEQDQEQEVGTKFNAPARRAGYLCFPFPSASASNKPSRIERS